MIKIIKIVAVCLWAILLAACMQGQNRAAPDNFIEADTNSVPDTFWVQPEELGWSSGYSEYMTSNVSLNPGVPMDSFSAIGLSFLPQPEGKYPPPADFPAGQSVYIFSDGQTAVKAFEEMKRGGELAGIIWQFLPLEDELGMDTGIGACNNDYIKLVDMRARWYDPAIGRFISPDSIIPDPTNPQSFNRYSYVFNRPMTHT